MQNIPIFLLSNCCVKSLPKVNKKGDNQLLMLDFLAIRNSFGSNSTQCPKGGQK